MKGSLDEVPGGGDGGGERCGGGGGVDGHGLPKDAGHQHGELGGEEEEEEAGEDLADDEDEQHVEIKPRVPTKRKMPPSTMATMASLPSRLSLQGSNSCEPRRLPKVRRRAAAPRYKEDWSPTMVFKKADIFPRPSSLFRVL